MCQAVLDGRPCPRIERGRLRSSSQGDSLGGRGDGLDGQVPDFLGGGCVDQGEQAGQRLVRVNVVLAAVQRRNSSRCWSRVRLGPRNPRGRAIVTVLAGSVRTIRRVAVKRKNRRSLAAGFWLLRTGWPGTPRYRRC